MRVLAKTRRDYPLCVRLLFWLQRRKYGEVLYPSLLWARVPALFAAVSFLYGVIQRKGSHLDASLRSLLLVRVSQINCCSFCIDVNSANHAHRAGAADKVQAVSRWRESDLFDAGERCALEYAEAMTIPARGVTDELARRLCTFLDDDTIVELTAAVAYQNMSTKFNNALDVPSQGFCELQNQ